MRATITTFTIAIATTTAIKTAAADGYFEGVAGLAVPVADDDYDNYADDSFKIGVRAGGGSGPTALELSADFTMVNPEFEGSDVADPSAQRYRVLIGARHRVPVGKASLFVRLGAGVDIARASVSGTIPVLGSYEYSDTDPGIAAEVGMGMTVPVGDKLYLGGHFAVPLAFHFDENDQNDPNDVYFDYTGVDLDLLFTIGTRQ
jgi:hypothetical protein